MGIFSHAFMIRAFLVAISLSLAMPLIGSSIVLRRMSSIGDALAHTSLAGVAAGLCLGIHPIVGAIALSVCAAIALDWFRNHFSQYAEIATVVVLSLGIGLAAVLSSFVPSATDFNSFLFGSMITISTSETIGVSLLCVVIAFLFLCFYWEVFSVVFDEIGAQVSGIRVQVLNIVMNVMTAVVVSIAARTVGSLIVSSLLVLPVACAMQISKSYRQNVILSIVFAMGFMVLGLVISFYANLKPGGTIVLFNVIGLFFVIVVKKWRKSFQNK